MVHVVSAWDRPNGTTVLIYGDGTHRVVRIPDAVTERHCACADDLGPCAGCAAEALPRGREAWRG